MKHIAALFVRPDSIYKTLPGVDCYDMERDARTWQGGCPVVAHPPCRAWASLRNWAKPREGEKELAIWAVEQVRRFGGVLEHPLNSTLWSVARLPEWNAGADEFGGRTLIVHQHWWGHCARKATRLYIVGCEPRDWPPLSMRLGEATHTVGLWSKRDRATCKPSISKREFEATPPAFAEWLVELARRCCVDRPQRYAA